MRLFLSYSRLRHLVNNVAIHIYAHDYIRMASDICIVFANCTASIVDLMVLHETTFSADEGMFPLFTHLSADYRLRHLVNKYTSLYS